jgi:hypothetical protein
MSAMAVAAPLGAESSDFPSRRRDTRPSLALVGAPEAPLQRWDSPPTEAPAGVPCAARPSTGFRHFDGPCQCFFGGPPPSFPASTDPTARA